MKDQDLEVMLEQSTIQVAGQVAGRWHPDAQARARRADLRGERGLSGSLARVLRAAYGLGSPRGYMRAAILRRLRRLDGGQVFSHNTRRLLADHHGVEIGKYSYGDILRPGVLPRGSRVGAYCSVGADLRVSRRDHPVDRPFLHPAFYNAALGLLMQDAIPANTDNPLRIGHDVWIGDRVTILGGCGEIGNGAVIGAGAVVTRDVPAYALVAGVPARTLRQRFPEAEARALEASAWWERDLADVIGHPELPDPFIPFGTKG
ncbi:MAG: CatB-related O-acetyltransferase [Pseudomonadota bacterium]